MTHPRDFDRQEMEDTKGRQFLRSQELDRLDDQAPSGALGVFLRADRTWAVGPWRDSEDFYEGREAA